jgi:hypothetical protein
LPEECTQMDRAPKNVPARLAKVTKGDQQAASKRIPLIHDNLRRLAGRYMCRERADHALQGATLVPDADLKLGQPALVFSPEKSVELLRLMNLSTGWRS